MRYIVFSDNDPNDCFYVDAEDFETALHDALGELGWLIAEYGEDEDVEDLDEDEARLKEFYDEMTEDGDVDYN